jgi:hypothetical protein
VDREEAVCVIKNNWPCVRYSMLREALLIAIADIRAAAKASATPHNRPSAPCQHEWVGTGGHFMFTTWKCAKCGEETDDLGGSGE